MKLSEALREMFSLSVSNQRFDKEEYKEELDLCRQLLAEVLEVEKEKDFNNE